MKRSEARKKIEDSIRLSPVAKAWSKGFKNGTVSWEVLSDVLAEVALMAAEVEVEMLPPAHEQKFDLNIYGSHQTYEFCRIDDDASVNEWEPEDGD